MKLYQQKKSQFTKLSEEEKLAIMGVKSLEPFILKKPLTLYLGKGSHLTMLDEYKKMETYFYAVKFYFLLMKKMECKYETWWKVLYWIRLSIAINYYCLGVVSMYDPYYNDFAHLLLSVESTIVMSLIVEAGGFLGYTNPLLILINNLVYILVVYDFFMDGSLKKSFMKSFVLKKPFLI